MSIVVEHLTHTYNPGAPGERAALRDVSLRIEDGACAAIVGVTGSGKSTLVQHFNGLLRPGSGRVVVDGIDVGARETRGLRLRELRQRVGLVFQMPEAQLFAPTVYEDVAFGPRQLGLPEPDVRDRVRQALSAVALPADDAMLRHSPFTLSGGQKRRVALAGVLAMRPHTLVLDEPSAGLDAEARDELYSQLSGLRSREELTVVLVTHDMAEVARLADVVFVLAGGELRLSGTPDDVFRRADEIAACGLLPPALVQTLALAQAHGIDLRPESLSPDSLAGEILRLQGMASTTHQDGWMRTTAMERGDAQ